MFSTKAMRGGKQSLGKVQLLTQMPRRKNSNGAGSDLFQQQSKSGSAQLGNRQELSSLANGHLGHSKSPQLLEKPKNQQWRPNLISHMQHLSALAHPALANSQYPPIGPQNLEVHPVKKHDHKEMQEILDLFLDQFLFDEPLSYSLKLTREQAIPFFRDIVAACSRDNPAVSLLVRDSATSDNRLIGVLLNQLIRREAINDNLYEDRGYSPNVKEYCKIVHICEASVWDLLPKDINLACNNVFMSVHRDYQQMGIGQKMVELSELNVQQMEGVQAAVGELTSTGTQRIYAKCGYTPLLTVPYTGWLNEQGQQIVKTRDGAEGMQLVGKFYCYGQ